MERLEPHTSGRTVIVPNGYEEADFAELVTGPPGEGGAVEQPPYDASKPHQADPKDSDGRIYVVPTHLNLDPIDGYPDNNGVHPNAVGYQQIGTSLYCWLKWWMLQTASQ